MSGIPKRNRWTYLILALFSMGIGLGIRKFGATLPEFINLYAPDTIWALMIFFLIGFIFDCQSTIVIAIVTICITFGIEFSQLYKGVWIENIRATQLGALILGNTFMISDLITYITGVAIGAVLDLTVFKKKKKYIFKK